MRYTLPSCAFSLLLLPMMGHAQENLPVSGWLLQDSTRIGNGLTGIELSQPTYMPKDWYKATVPGTILTTLVDNKVYPEPLYGENNRPERIPESLCRTDWWYRTSLAIPAAYQGKRIWLNFDGINYDAYIWVNGRKAGPIKGAFIRGNFDITELVKPGKEAVIAVRISPQPHAGTPAEHTIGAGNGPIGGIGRLDGPTFACSLGWDWMPGIRDRNTGIWQKVFISTTGDVVVKDPFVTTDLPLPRTDAAAVTVQATVRNTGNLPQKGVIKGRFGDIAFEQPVELAAWGTRTITFDPKAFPQLAMKNPKLWWPNGYGDQNLYRLHLSFEQDGQVSDATDVTFGVREFTYAVPGSDSLALSVNGVRVFMKGGNWGMDEALKRIPRERLDAQVRMHRDANYTMIRNWGGQSTSQDLYDLCDQYGILLWDEFFQFNSLDPLDTDLYLANVRDKTLRFRNHASLVVWCGRNEATPPKYLDDAVRYLLLELDPARWYQSNSGHDHGCNSGGPYEWQTPIAYYRFADQKSFNKRETFKTEIGAISVPTIESIQGMMPEKSWSVINDDWAEHDFTAGSGRKHPEIITRRYGPIANLADFVRKGQLMNYEAYRAMYEGRQARMFAPVQGVLTWMSHPAQPSFVWQIYHYDLEPNAALFAVRKACEPVHIQLSEEGTGLLQVVNNHPDAFTGKARLTVYDLAGATPCQNDYDVHAGGSATTGLGAVAWPATLNGAHFVKLELRDAAGKLVSDHLLWRSAGRNPDDLTALETLPVMTLDTKAVRRTADGRCLIDVTLRNPGPQVALMAHLQLRRKATGERVLPVFYSDNYVSLAPQEEKTVTIEAALADLKGDQPLIVVDGWNIAVKATSSDAADITLNTNAQVGTWPRNGLPFAEPKLEAAEEFHLSVGGFARDGFIGDPGYLEGVSSWYTNPIDTTGVEHAAPESIYQTIRWANCIYSFPMKGSPSQTYTVRLHFAEWGEKEPGMRIFDVLINGKPVLTDFDTFKEAGGRRKAVVRQFTGITREANGTIAVELPKGRKGVPQICGIEILKEPAASR